MKNYLYLIFLFLTSCGPDLQNEEIYNPYILFFVEGKELKEFSGPHMYTMKTVLTLNFKGNSERKIEYVELRGECFAGIYRVLDSKNNKFVYFATDSILNIDEERQDEWIFYPMLEGFDRIKFKINKVKFEEQEIIKCSEYENKNDCFEQVICLETVENCEIYKLGLSYTN
jgi:hypothetical protein